MPAKKKASAKPPIKKKKRRSAPKTKKARAAYVGALNSLQNGTYLEVQPEAGSATVTLKTAEGKKHYCGTHAREQAARIRNKNGEAHILHGLVPAGANCPLCK